MFNHIITAYVTIEGTTDKGGYYKLFVGWTFNNAGKLVGKNGIRQKWYQGLACMVAIASFLAISIFYNSVLHS